MKLTVVQPTVDLSSQVLPVKPLMQMQLHEEPSMMLSPPLLQLKSFSQTSRGERALLFP